MQAGQVRRPGLLAGQCAGAFQRVRAVIVSAQGKLGKLLQKQCLIPAKEDVAVFTSGCKVSTRMVLSSVERTP